MTNTHLKCYYLMAFDQNMIIDATTGSIARFVNHSCAPNCRMEKWIVGGQPRMALFAGDGPILSGEELTYDYNFDPFSAKNVQKCLCGAANCRGVLGPKPRGEKVIKVPKGVTKGKAGRPSKNLKETVVATAKAGKRKLTDLLSGDKDEADTKPVKQRKIKGPTSVKQVLALASAKALKAGTSIVKKTTSSIAVKPGSKSTPVKAVRKSSVQTLLKTYSKNGRQFLVAGSRSTASTKVVAADSTDDDENVSPASLKLKKNKSLKAARGSIKAAKMVKTTGTQKKSVLTSPTSAKVTKQPSKNSIAGSISVKSPRTAVELSRAANKIRVVDDSE